MRNKLFILLIPILFIIGLCVFILPQEEMNSSEKREMSTNSDITLNTNIASDIEGVMKDQIIGRSYFVKFYYNTKMFFNKFPYKAIDLYHNIKGDSEYVTADYTYLSEDVIDLGDGYLINNVLVYNEDNLKLASQRGYNLNEVSLKYPDIKFYVYFPTKIEEILEVGDTNYGLGYRQAFIRELNESITYSSLNITNVEEHKEYFYKTDFHWTGKGAYLGYVDIINMINNDFEIGEPKEIKEEIVYDYPWQGTTSGSIGQVGGGDDYIVDEVLKDIGEYKYYTNGELANYGDVKRDYALNGNTTEYSDFDYYFGNNWYEKRFEFNDDSKPNILIFCDSFCNVNQEWIASHFNTSVFIDLRANDGSFNLDEYIKKYDIDIILTTQMYKNLYFNGNLFIPLD